MGMGSSPQSLGQRVFLIFLVFVLFHCSLYVCPQPYVIYFILLYGIIYSLFVLKVPLNTNNQPTSAVEVKLVKYCPELIIFVEIFLGILILSDAFTFQKLQI